MKIGRLMGGVVGIVVVSTWLMWANIPREKLWGNFDGLYYVVVAKTWYVKSEIANKFSFPLPLEYYPAHLPGYPIVIKAVSLLGLNMLDAMLVANLLATCAGAMMVVFVAWKYNWGISPLWAGIIWLFIWPRMWAVRSVGSPETMFVALILGSLYLYDKGKFFWSGVFGALAVLTKSPGILLFATYLLNWRRKAWPTVVIPVAALGLFGFYYLQTGDFWAYFNSGDNIHLQFWPFGVFDNSKPWVGTFWLEDVIWVYLLGGIGVYRALVKNRLWGSFGVIFFLSILFVSHRDISRYSLPIVPIVIWGLSEVLNRREFKFAFVLLLWPLAMYTLNFVSNNFALVGNWGPLL